MLSRVRQFLDAQVEKMCGDEEETSEQGFQLATAALLCVVLAVLLDVVLVLAQRVLTPWTRGVSA